MKNNFNNFLGLLLITAGLLFILSIMGILPAGLSSLLIAWPMILVIVGTLMLSFRNWWGGMTVLLVGIYFILPRVLHFLNIEQFDRQMINQWFWASVFVIVGLLFLFRPKGWPYSYWGKEMKVHKRNGMHKIEYAFGEYQFVPLDRPFLGASISAGFSTLTVDLSSVSLEKDKTILEINGGFTTVNLLIPDNIYVISHVKSFFGDVDDQRQEIFRPSPGDPCLELIGNIAFGTMNISNSRPRYADSPSYDTFQTEEPLTSEVIDNITVKQNKEVRIIPIDEVKYIQSEGDYVNLITAQGMFLKEETMKFFQNSLPAEKFLRIHRSYIVNLSEISSISSQGKEAYYVVLKDGTKLKASLQGYQLLKQKWDL